MPVAPISVPSWLTTLLGALAGLATGLLQSRIFTANPDITNQLTIASLALGAMVGPIFGAKFRNLLHLPAQIVGVIAMLTTGAGVVATRIQDPSVRGTILGVVALLVYLGFGPATSTQLGGSWSRLIRGAKTLNGPSA